MDESITIIKRNLPRDVFLHLFSTTALYWSAINFITLCWQYVNYFFPDINALRYGGQSYIWAIRFSVSSLVIVFPLFLLASWYLNKIYRRESAVRDSKIRKWLIYLTLFIAALVIIGDLVSLIYNFLGGEITTRFILKASAVLLVAAAVFGYYLDDVRRPEPSKRAKSFALTSAIVVLVAVIGAFFIVGSPKTARLSQLDQQRVNDLQNIQWQIVSYWQRKEQMPNTLADLQDPISGYVAPTDPATNQPFEYNLKSAENLEFQLCAAFDLPNDKSVPKPLYPARDGELLQNWEHSAGRVCFERQIDRQLYPPLSKGK